MGLIDDEYDAPAKLVFFGSQWHEGHIASYANHENPEVDVDVIALEELSSIELDRYGDEWRMFRHFVLPAIVATPFH